MRIFVRLAGGSCLLALVAIGAGCRRPGPGPMAKDHPGLDPQPSGLALWEGVPVPKPEGRTIDLSRPDSLGRSFEPQPEQDLVYEAAMRGEAWAQTKLGKSYVASPDDAERMQQGVDLLRRAAQQDDAEALYMLATLSAAGVGLEQSNVEAFQMMKRAAELGFADAQFALGAMYFEGTGTSQDQAAALAAFRSAAEGGHKEAMFTAARIMLTMPDPEIRAEGLGLMNRAIENGHIQATLILATAYGRGENGLPKDEAKAEALLKPGAERGDADCQFVLASLYKFGDTFAARRDEAQVWLQRAADQGHPKALEILRSESEER
jgi:TPR repeat protein